MELETSPFSSIFLIFISYMVELGNGGPYPDSQKGRF